MENLDFNNIELVPLNYYEMLYVCGGDSYSDGKKAGKAAGEAVRKIVGGVAILNVLFEIAMAL